MYRPNYSTTQNLYFQNVNRFKTKRTFHMMNYQNPSFPNQPKVEFPFAKRIKFVPSFNQNSINFTEKKDNDIEMQNVQYHIKPQIPERIIREMEKYKMEGYSIEKGCSYYHCKEDFNCK